MTDHTDVARPEGGIKLGSTDSTPDPRTRKSNNADRQRLIDALAQIALLHRQAREHGIALPNTAQEYRDAYAKYGGAT